MEVPTDLLGFTTHSLKYLIHLPFIHLSYHTGKAYVPPYSVSILVNTQCNLTCTHCFFDTHHSFTDPMSTEEIYKLIDQIYDIGVRQISLCGGEPLLYKKLFDLIRYIRKKNILVGFSTNGTLMTDDIMKEIFDSGLERISFSIDGTEAIHDSIRGKGTFAKTRDNLDRLLDENTRRHQLTIRINSVISNINLECLHDLFNFAKERHLKWLFNPFIIWNGEFANQHRLQNPNAYQNIIIPPERLPLLNKTLNELKKRKIKEGVLFAPDRFIEKTKEYYAHFTCDSRKCKVGAYSFFIQGNGKLFLCDQNITGVPGNVREKSLREIWYSKEFIATRKKMAECHSCMSNCIYTPTVWEMVKDFMVYPALRMTGIARFV